MGQDIQQKGDVGLDSTNSTFDEDAFHSGHSFGEGRAPSGVFDNHAVEVGGDGETGVAHAVHADAGSGGVAVEGDGSGVGGEVAFGVFCGDTALDGDTAWRYCERERERCGKFLKWKDFERQVASYLVTYEV